MADTGWVSCGTGASAIEDHAGFPRPWVNTGNITADDGANSSIAQQFGECEYLKGTNYGFSVPSGATIDGIEARVEVLSQSGDYARIRTVRVIKGGSLQSTNIIAGNERNFDGQGIHFETFGSSTELWGTTWSHTDVNSSGFGWAFEGYFGTGLEADVLQVKVYYTTSAENITGSIDASLSAFDADAVGNVVFTPQGFRVAFGGDTAITATGLNSLANDASVTLPEVDNTSNKFQDAIVRIAIASGAVASNGPLVRSATNPRLFVKANSPSIAVWMGGTHGFLNLQDAGHFPDASTRHAINWTTYLADTVANKNNLIRLWHTAVAPTEPTVSLRVATPAVYQRSATPGHNDGGNKFDLTLLNQAYFDRLKTRCTEAQTAGVYCNVMLFDHFSVESDPDYSMVTHNYTYWNPTNNVNGINANYNGDGTDCDVFKTTASAALKTAIELYVQKLVDTLCDGTLFNIIWDPGNELDSSTQAWQYYIINFLNTAQALKTIQFPIGITGGPGNDSAVFIIDNAPATVTWSSRGYEGFDVYYDMPNNGYGKVDISDSDHFGRGRLDDFDSETDIRYWWPFICLTRGYNVMHYDDILVDEMTWGAPSSHAIILRSIGRAQQFANGCANLVAMTPQGGLSSTGYCLASSGDEYLILRKATSGAITVFGLPVGTYRREWCNIVNNTIVMQADLVHGGGDAVLSPPSGIDGSMAFLYLRDTSLIVSTGQVLAENSHCEVWLKPAVLTGEQSDDSNDVLLGCCAVNAVATFKIDFELAEHFGTMPPFWKIRIVNRTGSALASSGHTVSYVGVYETVST